MRLDKQKLMTKRVFVITKIIEICVYLPSRLSVTACNCMLMQNHPNCKIQIIESLNKSTS